MRDALRVLLVEDNPDHAQLEKDALLEAYPEAVIDIVDNGTEACQKSLENEYTIIFLDYHIRGGNGLMVLKEVQPRRPDTPIVMVTAMGQQQLAVQALRAGASDYLFKTTDFFAHLPRLIETNLERHRLRRERDGLLRKAQEVAARTAIINEIAKAVRSSLDLSNVIQTLTEKLGETLQVSRCLVLQKVTDPTRVPAVHEYSTTDLIASSAVPLLSATRPIERSKLARLAVETKQLVLSDDVFNDDRLAGEDVSRYEARAVVFSPITLAQQVLGLLVLHQCDKPRRWQSSELELVRELTDQVAVAMRQAQLFDEISHAKKLWEKTFDSMNDAVTVHDSDGFIKRLNVAAMRLNNSNYSEMMGRTCCELEFPVPHSAQECLLRKSIRTGQKEAVEMIDQDRRTIYTAINPVLDGNDNVIGAVMVTQDITEQKKLQDQLMRSKKMRALGEMASSVAHDFNNILAVILGRAQLLQARAGDDDLLMRGLEIIVTSAKDGGRTVKRIQDFARVRTDHDFAPLNFSQLLRETAEITSTRWKDEAQLAGKSINFSIDGPDEVMVLGDSAELREVFVNLIFNAIDAMPDGGNLAVRLRVDDGRAIAQVRDSGSGISEDIRERIFDPFFTTKGLSGMGLGLSISYSIISRHGGVIEFESKPGHGSCFTVVLDTFAETADSNEDEHPKNAIPARILVVDDEAEVRQLLHDILVSAGHIVTMADDGVSAIALFEAGVYDMVLTDLGMPGMSGWEVAEAIKSRRPYVPVGLITGWAGIMEDADLDKRGIDVIVNKPFDMNQILNIVADITPAWKISQVM
ncbi:MAG TPA: response regulator [Blastocatellia bacterium]|nr:response regulator [Blastocatellia bacterium]